jgi:hypothetical protein
MKFYSSKAKGKREKGELKSKRKFLSIFLRSKTKSKKLAKGKLKELPKNFEFLLD